MSKARIWVDTDIALGTERGDVDDGFALATVLRAHQAGRVELLGVSAVAGNTDAARAGWAASELLALTLKRESGMPAVVAEQAAGQAIASLPAGASILALGPLGNVARAARIDPELPARTELRLVATVRNPRRHPILGRFCLNFRTDPVAAREVMALRFRKRLIFPLDVVSRLRVDSRLLRELSLSGQLGAYLAEHSQRWLRQAPLRYLSRSFPAWDLVAALDAVGDLPGARFDERDRLEGFDAPSAASRFLSSIRDRGPSGDTRPSADTGPSGDIVATSSRTRRERDRVSTRGGIS